MTESRQPFLSRIEFWTAVLWYPLGSYLAVLGFFAVEIFLFHNWESGRRTGAEFFARVALLGIGQAAVSFLVGLIAVGLLRSRMGRVDLRDILRYETGAVLAFFAACFLDVLFVSYSLVYLMLAPSLFLVVGLLALASKHGPPREPAISGQRFGRRRGVPKTGIDVLLSDRRLRARLEGRRVGFLGHPASVTGECRHSLDTLAECPEIRVASAFGPQHGMRGDKQDNMVESEDYADPRRGIPVFSLYGEVRHPTAAMLETFDVLLVDLQDVGTRIYTYVTTLLAAMEACAGASKEVWVLDRPNPAGRPVEGTLLEAGWESFVGAAPLIMRHGLTLGEIARWHVAEKGLSLDLTVVPMEGYRPKEGPGFGWPVGEFPWVNPSPNASSLNMARCFPGTVLLEGTTLSEGRGTTTPLEVAGAPDLDFDAVLRRMASLQPGWMEGCVLRPCCFEPTFHKHAGRRCSGFQIHAEGRFYRHESFRPYRLVALLLKSVRLEFPEYPLWRCFPYEYETERLAVDLLSGGTFLREWIDDPGRGPSDLEARLERDEALWRRARKPFLMY